MMRINVVSIFPEMMDAILATGMLAVAAKKGIAEYRTVSPRQFTSDFHRTVDDAPFGGGAGMIMMAPPIVDAVESLRPAAGSPVILMSPAGRRFDQRAAHRLAGENELTFVCGRYKGIDERVRELVVTEEMSIGDFVLSGGEIAAAAVIEATVRLLDDVLGNDESAASDSFEAGRRGGLDCAWYTRPAEYRGLGVPAVLMSGHHAEIEKWRRESSRERTRRHRPDLIDDNGSSGNRKEELE
ncbi:MAG TPA: tRNA (guanosine(37)-N1)-methyltransferase TrmD [Candidatus Krumholzibacteria bacterium]|nr:tRNA (guanosine(37)-N1)-methyltransferase TrmD [Candidatus Krumholzibacteria bacterium]